MGYKEAICDFTETEDCEPESVAKSPVVKELAKTYGKSVEQVARDINRGWLASYRSPGSKKLSLLD
jgi:hypothetical protein